MCSLVFYSILINLHGMKTKAHGVQKVVLKGFMILGLCMVKIHMIFFKDNVWSRSLVQVFNLVQVLSGV